MCAEKWQEIFPWTLVGSVLWDQHFNDVLSNYVRGKDTRPLCVLCGAGLWASQPRARLLSPSPEKSTLLHSWKNFSGLLALWQWRRRYTRVQTIASLQHFSPFFPAKGMLLACRACYWHAGTVPFVTPNILQTNFSFQSQHCLGEKFQQQNHGISLAASVLLSREQEHKEGQFKGNWHPARGWSKTQRFVYSYPVPKTSPPSSSLVSPCGFSQAI